MELLGQAHLILFLVQALDEARERGRCPSLARYMATSAHQTSRALSVASVGATAMPMLAPMLTFTECRGTAREDSR